MLISPISNTSFCSSNRVVYKNGKILYKNRTEFLRDSLDWKKLAFFLGNKYKDVDKVNVFNFACSDGSEPLSLAISLKEYLGETASKFFPIFASDKDKYIISKAKQGNCDITVEDLYRINFMVRDGYGKYFNAKAPSKWQYYMSLSPKPLLRDSIKYEQEDVLDGLDKLPEHNNVVVARNFWCYLDDESWNKMIRKFAQKLDKTSCLIIGELELGHGYDEILKQYGFKPLPALGVFCKED